MAHEIEYEQLLADEKKIKIKIKEKRQELGKGFKRDNKWKMRLLDILFIFMILANIGALIITNALVVKVTPEIEFAEVNPAAAETHGFKEHDDSYALFTGTIFHMLWWGIFAAYYLFMRYKVYSMTSFWSLATYLVIFSAVLILDFFNDFGYMIGVWIWG